VRTQQIRRLNGMPFGQTLRLHQKIKIPLTRTTAREFEENRYEFHKRLQEDFFAVYRVADIQPYRVMRGDNLWTLCLEKFDIPMWLLKNCNPEVDFADLHLHQKLMVPAIEKNAADDPDLPAEPEQDDKKVSMGTANETSL
jgi:membrane-bound lytic murein transglycosylase D